MKLLYIVLLCTTYHFVTAQQQPPGTEIYLFDLKISGNVVSLSNPVNITNHVGYDNQPHFHPKEPLLFYAAANQDGRTDIVYYNFKTKETRKLTETNEREYSPTVTPDGEFISCIIQRDNGEQNLGKYPLEGGQPVVLINDLVVGYHAWASDNRLIAFVLGQPITLHLVDLNTKLDTVLASSISRSLHKIPGTSAMSFLQKTDSELWEIKKLDPVSFEITTITQTMDSREHDINWSPDGKIFASDNERIHFFDTKDSQNSWRTVQLPSGFKKSITRLAIDPSGTKIALVVGE